MFFQADVGTQVIDNMQKKTSYAYEYFLEEKKATFDLKSFFSAIKINPHNNNYTYATLPGHIEEDKSKIIELFTILGTNSKKDLLFKYKSYCTNLGNQIMHVHPLKLIGILFSDPATKPLMKRIYEDFFKKRNVFPKMYKNLTLEAKDNNINKYISDFAEDVKHAEEFLTPYFKNEDWTGLIEFLIYHDSTYDENILN